MYVIFRIMYLVKCAAVIDLALEDILKLMWC